jgi:predicted  nucleic acid-binding Zn-ribbon protein
VVNDVAKNEPDTVLLRVEKPPGRAGIVPGFVLRYAPSHRTLSSDLAKVIEAAKADLDAARSDLEKAKAEIQQYRDSFQPGTTAIEQGIRDWTEKKEKAAANPQPGELTQEQFAGQIDKLKQDLNTQAVNLTTAIAPLVAKQKDADDRAAAITDALKAYGDLSELDVELLLPQGLHVGTVRLTKEGN